MARFSKYFTEPRAIITIASFNGAQRETVIGGVTLDSSGNLFGTTNLGGANSDGEVFEIVHGTSSITIVASFNNANGELPRASCTLDSSGNLFGTTEFGGANSDGTVFEIVHGTTAITTLASFNNANGEEPFAGVTLDSSGDLFGATYAGGTNSDGTIFEIVHGTTAITTLASFNNANGQESFAAVTLDSLGNLFGTTELGGSSNDGVIFELPHGTSAIDTLMSFNGINGALPQAGLIFRLKW